MQRFLFWISIALFVAIAFLLYRSYSRGRLDVSPDVERAIERAKHR
jgi:hypothetical protein